MRVTRFTFATFAALALAALFGGAANAQHLISSKAGFVNRAEGKVHILRSDADETERGPVSLGTQMRDGDRLMTEAGSRAEVLLNPGSYLRLDENTVVRALNTGLTQIRFELVKGVAIVEIGQVEKKTPIEIVAPGGPLTFAKDGLHRIDARREPTIVMVRQGELQVGTREQFLAKQTSKIGRGKTAQLTGAPKLALAKLDRDAVDEFDRWSFIRAQTLMAANLSTLSRSRGMNGLAYGWTYDPFFNCYTYIPGRGLFFSPYGFGFFRSYSDSMYYYPYGYNNYGGYYGGGGGGGLVANPPARVIAGNDRAPVRREIESRRIDANPGGDASAGGGFDRGSSRTISAPSPSVPVTSTQSVGGISAGKGGKP